MGLWAPLNASAQAQLSVTPDRSTIAENETLTLTVRYENGNSRNSPDFSPLQANFDILGNSQSSQYVNNNGRVTQFIQWVLTLAPKQSGKLLIPPIQLDGAQSSPFSITVTQAQQQARGEQIVFLETFVSSKDVYVQEQFLITIKLYVKENITDFNAAKFAIPNTDIQELPQAQYQTTIGHSRYAVYEMRFAVTPDTSGTLEVPSYLWSMQTSAAPTNRFGMGGGKTTLHRLHTEALSINVKPRPQNYPANAPWLPAREVTIHSAWSQNPPHFTVGEPVTRTITLSAKGLSGEQLPPITAEINNSNFTFYPDQPKIESSTDDQGKLGSRTQSMAIVPNTAGSLRLPAINITWWNTQTNKLEVATLPEETITVAPAAINKNTPPPSAILPTQLPSAPPTTSNAGTPVAYQTTAGFWPWLCALLLMGNAIQLAMYLWPRRTQRTLTTNPQPTNSSLKTVIAAAQKNDAHACHQALHQWFRQTYPKPTHNLQSTLQELWGEDLGREITTLDEYLFKNSATPWQGRALANLIARLAEPTRPKNAPDLPTLYPASN